MTGLKAFSALTFLLVNISCSIAQSTLMISPSSGVVSGVDMSALEDSESVYTPQQLRDSVFTLVEARVPNLGVTHSTYWIKFNVGRSVDAEELWLLIDNPSLDYLELFWEEDGVFQSQVVTETVAFNKRRHESPFPIFDLPIRPGSEREFLLKVWGKEQIQLPFKIGEKGQVMNDMSTTNIWIGLYVGIILLMVFYNFFIYVSVKDDSYIHYVLFILAVGFAQIITQGVQFQYLHPNLPWISEIGFFVFPALAGITGLTFQRVFLSTRENLPIAARLIYVFIGLYVFSGVVGIFVDHVIGYNVMQFSAMAVSVYLLTVSIILAKRGKREAKFFLVAWSIFLLGVILFILKDNGVIPYNTFTKNTMQIGSALEVILLSIALADKINTFKKEKEESAQKALEAVKENERIVKEQNLMLEQKVAERTVALESTNSELSTTLSDLQTAQSQLVDAEKMASLGQMTAGIAHELNNPINFVSSNINPLKRDIEDLFELLDKYEGLKDGDNIRLQLDAIEKLKEDLEIDFLKKEIDDLLNGINEGAERTTEIVKGLRVFSRLDEDALKPADINDCLKSTLVIVKSNLKGECNVEEDYSDDIEPINCHPGRINQVFMNILNNAVQATQMSEKPASERLVKVKSWKEDNQLKISIADNGIGISDVVRPKIFDPFFTTKEVGDGTGLGLSIVLGIINDHEGNIEVHSEVGEGSEFVITLPTDR